MEVGLDNAEQLDFTSNVFPVKLKDIDRLERLKPEIHANGSEDTKINRLIISEKEHSYTIADLLTGPPNHFR